MEGAGDAGWRGYGQQADPRGLTEWAGAARWWKGEREQAHLRWQVGGGRGSTWMTGDRGSKMPPKGRPEQQGQEADPGDRQEGPGATH